MGKFYFRNLSQGSHLNSNARCGGTAEESSPLRCDVAQGAQETRLKPTGLPAVLGDISSPPRNRVLVKPSDPGLLIMIP